jgi:phosphatidate cytidylyltransferase
VKNLTQRVLMALWGIPLILLLSYLGGYYFLALIMLINGMSLWEFYSIYQKKNLFAYRLLGVLLSCILILITFYYSLANLFTVLLIIILTILIRHLKISEPNTSLNTILTIAGIFYITLFLAILLRVRMQMDSWMGWDPTPNPTGKYFLLVWISIWICDTAAYFGGKALGKHKLAPLTSPHKTVEGAIFGFIGAVLTFYVLAPLLVPQLPVFHLLISGLIVAVFGQLGDLVESRFKRDAGVKDTSTILPGHGGFFDRFDSVILVSPFLYILFHYFKP